jgi:hypothetical protein
MSSLFGAVDGVFGAGGIPGVPGVMGKFIWFGDAMFECGCCFNANIEAAGIRSTKLAST